LRYKSRKSPSTYIRRVKREKIPSCPEVARSSKLKEGLERSGATSPKKDIEDPSKYDKPPTSQKHNNKY
jgi:hypothetical protein